MIGRAIFGGMRPHAGAIRLDGGECRPRRTIPDRIAAASRCSRATAGAKAHCPACRCWKTCCPIRVLCGAGAWRPAPPGGERRRTAATLAPARRAAARPDALIEWLSGGNQQKVFVGRWLESGATAVRDGGADGGGGHRCQVRHPRTAARCGGTGAGSPGGVVGFRGGGNAVRSRIGDRPWADHR